MLVWVCPKWARVVSDLYRMVRHHLKLNCGKKGFFMAVNDHYKLTVEWSNTAIAPRFVNSFYFQQADDLVLDTAGEDLVARFLAEAGPDYADLVTSQLSVVRISVGKFPDFPTEYELTTLPILDGTLTGDPLPVRTAGIFKYQTEDFTRRGRGRIFLPPASEAVNTAGQPNSTWKASGDAFALHLLEMFEGSVSYAGWQWELYSRADAEFKPIVAGQGAAYWSSRRKRKAIYT